MIKSLFKIKYLLLTLIIATTCSFCLKKDDNFQGKIIYDLEYTQIHPELSEDQICPMVGEKVIYHHSNLGYVKQNTCDEEIISTIWFNGIDNSLQMHITELDTMFIYLASHTDHTAIINKTEEVENILGYDCVKYEVYLEPLEGNDAPPMKYDYFMALDIKIDTKAYENYIDGGYSDLLKLAPCINLKSTYYGAFYSQTRIAKRIIPGKVNLKKLRSKKDLILKEI